MKSMHVQGEMMDAVGGGGDMHHFRHVLTDLTLSLIQDSGWCVTQPTAHTTDPLLRLLPLSTFLCFKYVRNCVHN
jgi:hypothetical protein